MIRWDSKELLDEVRHELFLNYNYSVSNTEIMETVRSFFSMSRQVIATTKPMDTKCVFGSIHIPFIGKIKLNENAKRRYAVKMHWKARFKEGSSEEQVAVAESLYGYGWRYFKWTLWNGYIFVHEASGEVRCIETNEVRTLIDAKKKFLGLVEENYYINGVLPRLELNLVPFVWNPIRGIYQYSLNGKFIRKYENIHEVCLEYKVLGIEVREKLMHNKEGRGFNSPIGDYFFVLQDGYVGPRVFHNPIQSVKYTQIVSILDRITEEPLFKHIGTILEASKFLKYMGKKGVIEPYYIYKKGIIEKKTIYGYKWRREDTVKDDNLQEERNK